MNYKNLNVFKRHKNKTPFAIPKDDIKILEEISTYKEAFIHFMKEKQIFETFKNRIKECSSFSIKDFDDLINTSTYKHWILEAFRWSKSKEGFEFWEHIEIEWDKFYRSLHFEEQL